VFASKGLANLGGGELDQAFDEADIGGDGRDQAQEAVLFVGSQGIPDREHGILHILGEKIEKFVNFGTWFPDYLEINLAKPKAAAAASPPIKAVCSALRMGCPPVKRPLTYPKMSSAKSVKMTENKSAEAALEINI